MSTLKNFEMKLAMAMMAAGLTAGAAFAGTVVKVTLPDDKSAGSTIEESREGSPVWSTFAFRDGNGDTAAVARGQMTADSPDASKPGVEGQTPVRQSADTK